MCSNKLKVKMQIWRICNIAILQFPEMVQFSGDIPTVRIGWDTRGWCILLPLVCLEFKTEKQSYRNNRTAGRISFYALHFRLFPFLAKQSQYTLDILDMYKFSTKESHLTLCQCCGSMTFWCGSGSADPCRWLMDPDPAIFVIDLQDASKKLIF